MTMKQLTLTYRFVIALIVSSVLFVPSVMQSQTVSNTTIVNQAKAAFQYKSFPTDSIESNPVQFTVLAAPNFEISFGSGDSLVFGKETLLVRIVYKNVGNTKADTALVNGQLPSSGLRFVPGSTLGSINGVNVSWKVFNIEPGKTDSVEVKLVVDSNLVANTLLQMQGSISWSASQATTNKRFIISSFPRLGITNTPSAQFVGSGRTLTYQIVVSNTGNVQTNNVTLVDTLSSLSTFTTSSVTPDSIRNNGKILVWKLGNIPPFGQRTISVTVSTPPNLGSGEITNASFSYATNFSAGTSVSVSTPILPIVPKSISISAEPKYIFGQINQDSAKIDVVLKDSLNQVLPDGAIVQFSSTIGTYPNNQKNISASIQNGIASVYVRAENVTNDVLRSTITAVGGVPASGTVRDSAYVFLYPGAVAGKVVSGLNRIPFAGAIARVYNTQNNIVGADTTKNDGKFFVPLNKDVTAYLLEIIVIDKFGDTVVTRAPIDPTQFPRPAIEIPNTISGRIVYNISGMPVPAEGIIVYLDSVTTTGGTLRLRPQNSRPFGIYSRIDHQITDNLGRFKFENLKPAKYLLSLDSTQLPSINGFSFVADTVSGTFTINLSIEIQQDSTVAYTMSAPATVFAGDTLPYTIIVNNNGNFEHNNVAIIDTLPSFSRLLVAGKGKFKTFLFDTLNNIARWSADSLIVGKKDTLKLSLILSRNVPDSTRIINTSWFSSNLLSQRGATNITTVRSAPILSFNNFFVGRDSIVAGDSVYKRVWFTNTGTDSIKGLKIVDSIYAAGKSKIGLVKSQLDSVSVLDSVVTVFIGAIAPGQTDSVTLRFYTDFTLATGTTIVSSAHLMKNDSSLFNRKTSVKLVENPNIQNFLKITKTGNKKVGEIGDIVTYQVLINNNSPAFVHSIGIYDLLPHAFRYIKNSARYNGKVLEPMHNQRINSLSWNPSDTILTNSNGILVYQLAIGADAMESEGMNTAYASAITNTGFSLVSTASQWQVTIRPGVFTEKGLIIGKVFYDDNRNTFQEAGESGIKDVEIWLEDGTKITTGDDGKFSLPEVRPGQHVLRINEKTLPTGSTLLPGNYRSAKDPISQFVRLTEGGIAKANFFIARTLADSIEQGMSKINKLFSVRQAVPKFVYEDTLRKIKVDTVTMYVSFVFTGSAYLQSIEVNEILPQEMMIVPNSATFNGRRVIPIILGDNVQWRLGRAQEVSQGVLQYKAVLKNIPRNNTIMISTSTVKVMTADSVYIESQRLLTENVVKDVSKNKIETSDVLTKMVGPEQSALMKDSVAVTEGDDVSFKISLFIDPKKKIKSVKLIDSLEAYFVINERSFTINGVPLPSRNLSVQTRSSLLSSRILLEKQEIEFMRIASADLTDMIRKGINEIAYTARLISVPKDTVLIKTAYSSVVNDFNEITVTRSNDNRIFIRASRKLPAIALETLYVDIPRPVTNVREKIAEAMKLFNQLNESSSGSFVMEGITFEPGKSVLMEESKTVLDNIAYLLKENKSIKLQVNGHTDNTGNSDINRTISLARARSVVQYLISAGIDENRLFAQGFGPDKPLYTNKTEEGRSKNRRVEFTKLPR